MHFFPRAQRDRSAKKKQVREERLIYIYNVQRAKHRILF